MNPQLSVKWNKRNAWLVPFSTTEIKKGFFGTIDLDFIFRGDSH